MKGRDITIDDAIAAIDKEIDIAMSVDTRSERKKRLTFNPATLRYSVFLYGSVMSNENSCEDPLIAIEKYNEYYV